MGHAERLGEKYRLTAEGIIAHAVLMLVETFNFSHNYAYTFGALVEITGLQPKHLVNGLIQLLDDDFVKMRLVGNMRMFYLCPHQNGYRLFGGKDEHPECPLYQEYVDQILQRISGAGAQN